jgi:hypothetical protein
LDKSQGMRGFRGGFGWVKGQLGLGSRHVGLGIGSWLDERSIWLSQGLWGFGWGFGSASGNLAQGQGV